MLLDGGGLECLRRARQENLAVGVAAVTGVGEGELLDGVMGLKRDGFFQKPVDMQQMLAWLRGSAARGEHPSP